MRIGNKISNKLNPYQVFIAGIAVTLIAVIVISIMGGLASHFLTLRKSESANAEEQNRKFMKYMADHDCERWSNGEYLCDTGWWSEDRLIKVANGRYPN